MKSLLPATSLWLGTWKEPPQRTQGLWTHLDNDSVLVRWSFCARSTNGLLLSLWFPQEYVQRGEITLCNCILYFRRNSLCSSYFSAARLPLTLSLLWLYSSAPLNDDPAWWRMLHDEAFAVAKWCLNGFFPLCNDRFPASGTDSSHYDDQKQLIVGFQNGHRVYKMAPRCV